jgi:hypothetical protein
MPLSRKWRVVCSYKVTWFVFLHRFGKGTVKIICRTLQFLYWGYYIYSMNGKIVPHYLRAPGKDEAVADRAQGCGVRKRDEPLWR